MPASILVIDDSATNRELTVYILNAAGYRALTAPDGDAGISLARAERPDLVLCDINLPTLDGYDVARIFRDDPDLSSIPIFAFTASRAASDLREFLDAGFLGSVPKPLTPEAITTQLAPHLPK